MSTTPRRRVTLLAPVSGILVPMETVPDPVFAQKLVGEGISIDPFDGRLHAPVDGEVVQIHPSGHALTLRTADGLDILLHVGLDTVTLRGEGFTAHITAGAQVHAGDLLVSFDLDLVARRAKSLLTQVVVTSTDLVSSLTPLTGCVEVGDPVAEVRLSGRPARDADDAPEGPGRLDALDGPSPQQVMSPIVLVPNPFGLHARPAAMLARAAQRFSGDVRLMLDDVRVNAKSIIAVMGLEVGPGAGVRIIATGPDAERAAEELSAAIAAGLGEEGVTPLPVPAPWAPQLATTGRTGSNGQEGTGAAGTSSGRELVGAAASPGLAVGTVVQVRHEDVEVVEEGRDHHSERRRLNDAIDRAQTQLWALEDRLRQEADLDKAAIFGAHREILRDPELLDLVTGAIDKGKGAAFAWRAAYTVYADRLAALSSTVLAARALDVRDVGQRVLEELTGHRAHHGPLPPHSILVAEHLSAAGTATLDRSLVVGVVTTGGGASSHAAILARSLDIPAVAGIDVRALDIPDGTRAVIDGASGTLRFDVTEAEVERIWRRQARRTERRAVELAHAHEPAVTVDGHRIRVLANVAGVDDAYTAVAQGAEGVGLLRSEFLFLGRGTAPDEDEQAHVYRQIARTLPPHRPLVVRTLDVGGDKALPFLGIPPEENPLLGERGVRAALARPAVLRTQLRAVLRTVGVGPRVHVAFPMIATLDDYRAARAILEEERERLGVEPIPVGIMVEVPSVALTAPRFAAEADFFCLGTNDLAQYTLAMDRGHPKLAPQVDGLHPAVLALVRRATAAAAAAGRWAAVCGGIAADPQAVPLLIGLGVLELSVAVPALPAVKALVRTLSLEQCRALAEEALGEESAAAVRALVPTSAEEDAL